MSSFTPNAKRRRLEQASTALSKPFKSPLRRPTPTAKQENTTPKPEEAEESTASSNRTTESIAENAQAPLPTPPPTNQLPTPPHNRKRPPFGQRPGLTTRKPVPIDPEIANLQKQQRETQSRLSNLRSELDTAQQALRIESSNREEELEALIAKWKKVSQDAAEEVFSGAQERISRMGGVKAWHERMRNDDARWEQEEMESWFGNVDAEGMNIDEDEVRERKEEMSRKIEKEKEKIKKDAAKEREDEPEVGLALSLCPWWVEYADLERLLQEFTMDMMLKTLNIDLKSIGYEKADQRWIKG